jgi:probable rRNA maturation factor
VKLSLSRSDEAELPWLGDSLLETMKRVGASLEPSVETVNLVVVNDDYIRRLNRNFRDIDKPTDVISFSYLNDDSPRMQDEDDIVGEVYVSHQTIEKEAKLLGVNPGTLFLRIGVHGLLHIIGYDHVADDDALRMEAREKALLSAHLPPEELEELFRE